MMRPSLACFALLALGVALPGCSDRTLPPEGQLVIFVDTDAPLESSTASQAGILTTAGLFDRLRIEVLAADGSLACAACEREFVVTADDLDAQRLSFGVRLPPSAGPAYRARIRLFVEETRESGQPRYDTTIDGLFALPRHGADGLVAVTAFLPFETVAVPVDMSAPGTPLAMGRVFRNARVVGKERPQCTTDPTPYEACVPGGAFWAKRSDIARPGSDTWHAIVLSPFFLDLREVTVADVRASKRAKPGDPKRTSGTPSTCTYTEDAAKFEALPVTCMTADFARGYCAGRDAFLPTGAQLEYARGRLSSKTYVWGLDTPTCFDAVWSRGNADGFDECAALGAGPQPAGRGARDRLVLPTGTILDLAGNVAEMLLDWPPTCVQVGVLVDPVCGPPLTGAAWGSFGDDRAFARAPVRQIVLAPIEERLGFRCARPDNP